MSDQLLKQILSEMKEMKTSMDRMEGNIKELDSKVLRMEGNIEEMDSKVLRMESNMATKDDIQQLDKKIDSIMEQVATNSERLTRIETDVSHIKSDVSITYQKTAQQELEINRMKNQ